MMRTALLAGATIALGVSGLAGCGSDDDSGSTSRTNASAGKAEVCRARDDLRESVGDLADPTLLTSGRRGIQSALDDVQDDLNALGRAAESDYETEVDGVRSSIDDLKTAVANLGEGSLSEGIEDVGSAISQVGRSTEPLLTKLRADCPSS